MRSSVEPLEGNKVKVSVEVDEAEFESAIDAAFRKIAREVRIPGFRPGKAPRRILETRVGSEVGRQQALQDSLPEFYARAVREHDVDVIAAPEVEITNGREEGPVSFEATVEIRPKVLVPGYASLRVEVPSPAPTEEEIDEQLDRMRQPYAKLEDVEREAQQGDVESIDLFGHREGEGLPGLEASGYLYEVGKNSLGIIELDNHLDGASAGDEIEFTAAHPNP